jgi:hypothetical protein
VFSSGAGGVTQKRLPRSLRSARRIGVMMCLGQAGVCYFLGFGFLKTRRYVRMIPFDSDILVHQSAHRRFTWHGGLSSA